MGRLHSRPAAGVQAVWVRVSPRKLVLLFVSFFLKSFSKVQTLVVAPPQAPASWTDRLGFPWFRVLHFLPTLCP